LFMSEKQHLNTNPVFSYDSTSIFYASNTDGEWHIENRKLDDLGTKTQLNKGYVVKPCKSNNCYYYFKHKEPIMYKSVNGSSTQTGVMLNNIDEPHLVTIIDELVYYLNLDQVNLKLLVQDMDTKAITSVMPISGSQFSIQEEPFRVYTTISRTPETLLQSVQLHD